MGEYKLVLDSEKKGGLSISSVLSRLKKSNSASVLIVLIALVIVMSILKPDFLSYENFDVLSKTFSITAIVGVAQMIIIAIGGMNLSVGAIGGLSGIFLGLFLDKMSLPISVSIIGALLVGVICGLFNGLLISRVGKLGIGVIGFFNDISDKKYI